MLLVCAIMMERGGCSREDAASAATAEIVQGKGGETALPVSVEKALWPGRCGQGSAQTRCLTRSDDSAEPVPEGSVVPPSLKYQDLKINLHH